MVESVSESVEQSPADALLTSIAAMEEQLKQLKKAAKAALKGKLVRKAKKDPAAPKAERPAQTSAWSDFVAATKELMESSGWPAFVTKKGTAFAASEETEDGTFVFEDTKKKPVYKDAMAYAGFRKDNGEYVDPGAEARAAAAAAKAAEKEATKAAAAAAREAAKAEKQKQKDAEKAAKEAEKAEKKAAKEAAAAAAAAAKAAKAKPGAVKAAKAEPKAAKAEPKAAPAKAAGGAGAKASPAAAEKPEPKAMPKAEAKPEAADEEEETPKPWDFKGKKYYRNGLNQVWEMQKNKMPGAWVGVYDPLANKIDTTAEAPEFEFEE